MRHSSFATARCAVTVVACLAAAASAQAKTVRVPAGAGALAAAIGAAAPGDTLTLASGRHAGPISIRVPLVLRGEPGATIQGPGHGSVVEVLADGVAVEDLEIRGSGRRVLTVDSGIRVIQARGVALRRVRLADVLYGVYAERASSLEVEGSRLIGQVRPLDEGGEGNGIHLWYCRDAVLSGNDITRFADGIYLSFADDAHVESGRSHDNGRYGLHTMYCQRTRLLSNVFTRNVAGIAIMFSNGLDVRRNLIVRNRGPRTYGLLLRDCSAGRFEDNQLVDNTVGIFMDNSNRNRLAGNLIEDNGWGVILFSSCAGNEFAGNDFVHDDYPIALDMRRTDNRFDDGRRGNYWSGSAPFDLDADGISDAPFSPVSAFAFVSKQYPDLSVLAESPAVAALAVAERVFPSLRPSEAVDRFPLVRPAGRRSAAPPAPPAGGRSWTALGAFAGLLALGLAGLARGRLAS